MHQIIAPRNPRCASGIALVITAIVMLCQAVAASATEVKVISSTGMSTILKQLIPAFEQASGHKVAISYDTSNIILGRIKNGESADLIILTAPAVDALAKAGTVVAGSRTALARSGIGVAVKSGAAKPDISSVAAFKQSLLDAKSITYTATGASGIYFAGVLDKLGIASAVKAKAKTPDGGHVAELVARGDAEMGVQMISELRVAGTDYVGPLPGELQMFTVFSTGLMAGAREVDTAKVFVRFLISPDAARAYQTGGMEAVGR